MDGSPPNPTTLSEKPHAEFMFGSGIEMGTQSFFDALGCADDSQVEFRVSAYLGGALAAYFGRWWGSESADEDEDHFERGRVKKAWSGVLGISADGLPWVGSLPSKVSGRLEGSEWIAAGYSGEGMVHPWMSGKALAYMVVGKDVDWLPAPFRITEKGGKRLDEKTRQFLPLTATCSRSLSIIDIYRVVIAFISASRPVIQFLFTCLLSCGREARECEDQLLECWLHRANGQDRYRPDGVL